MSSGRLADRVAIVTGAASGIGAATAARFAAEGATVALADIAAEGAAQVAAGLGGGARAYRHDVADRGSWERLLAAVTSELGPVVILVNNAGITRDRTLLKMTDDEWHAVLDVHLRGTWLGCQHVVPAMRDAGGGAIVNLSSEARHGQFGQTNYSAAKAGIVGLTRSVALEHARHGIRANAVAPGAIETPMTDAVPQAVREGWLTRIPFGRFGQPAEVAAAIAFLVSDDASYVSGQTLAIDGASTSS